MAVVGGGGGWWWWLVVVDAWQPRTVVAIGDRAANRCEFTEFTVLPHQKKTFRIYHENMMIG